MSFAFEGFRDALIIGLVYYLILVFPISLAALYTIPPARRTTFDKVKSFGKYRLSKAFWFIIAFTPFVINLNYLLLLESAGYPFVYFSKGYIESRYGKFYSYSFDLWFLLADIAIFLGMAVLINWIFTRKNKKIF